MLSNLCSSEASQGFWVRPQWLCLTVFGWQVQDEAAGLVVALLDPHPGEDILDACAAPGGKALYAASRMQGQVSKASN